MKAGQALVVICMAAVLLAGCAAGQDGTTPAEPGYKKITAREAKEIMDNEDVIILDVRSRDENEKEHIQNAVLLPNTEIESLAEEMLPDKNATILIYCKTGKKSAEAAEKLVKMGYTKVYDFGGIEDWPYQTVKWGYDCLYFNIPTPRTDTPLTEMFVVRGSDQKLSGAALFEYYREIDDKLNSIGHIQHIKTPGRLLNLYK